MDEFSLLDRQETPSLLASLHVVRVDGESATGSLDDHSGGVLRSTNAGVEVARGVLGFREGKLGQEASNLE